jgi:hypothetical protein
VVSFTPPPLNPRGSSPWYALGRRLGGPQSRSGSCGEEKSLALPGIEPGPSSLPLYQLSYTDSVYCVVGIEILNIIGKGKAIPVTGREGP